MIPFVREFDFAYGRPDRLSPLVERIVAPNPGPFTFTGTGVYIVGRAEAGAGVAVIDPGPLDEGHLRALLGALKGRTVSHILVTHAHRDHYPLAAPLSDMTGASVLAAGGASSTHASDPENLEAGDGAFRPDRMLADGERIMGDGWTLETVATPGHASDHLAFALIEENALFSGDHVMGWSTSVVAPPDGDMAAYLGSLERVSARDFGRLYPTHGAPIEDPAPFLSAYREHRLERERQILARLTAGDTTIRAMVPALYAGVDERLWPAASLSMLAHLIKLVREGRAVADPAPTLDAAYRPA
ncbi:MBL fold metallo-hydrolase [Brevundimonas sp. Leaf363]|uniref:MBL fold metallo-hydrolase n=1 Tax=Brevundimonas sp. Leaf363 TaxID=1736353 RepID=UPI0006F74884|nr:MBL fold metallo-hydrolase [Brevundimonas sp. Leaf363]KQS55679.1 MBL fold metallo-hydrolase [Brevundimonas sp. Leaf363]